MVLDDHSWSFMVFTVILYWGHAVLEERQEPNLAGLDWLNSIEFYHRPSDLCGKLFCLFMSFFCFPANVWHTPHKRPRCYEYLPNSTVWQDSRKPQPMVQDKPKIEDSVPSIFVEKCYGHVCSFIIYGYSRLFMFLYHLSSFRSWSMQIMERNETDVAGLDW